MMTDPDPTEVTPTSRPPRAPTRIVGTGLMTARFARLEPRRNRPQLDVEAHGVGRGREAAARSRSPDLQGVLDLVGVDDGLHEEGPEERHRHRADDQACCSGLVQVGLVSDCSSAHRRPVCRHCRHPSVICPPGPREHPGPTLVFTSMPSRKGRMTSPSTVHDVIIVGSGPAGYTAASTPRVPSSNRWCSRARSSVAR